MLERSRCRMRRDFWNKREWKRQRQIGWAKLQELRKECAVQRSRIVEGRLRKFRKEDARNKLPEMYADKMAV